MCVSAFIVRSQHSVGPSKIATFIRNEDARASRSNEKLSLSLSRVGWCHGKPLTPIVVSLIFILAFAGRRWRLGNPWSATRSPGPHENVNLVRLASKVDGLNVCMAFLLLRVLLVLGGGLMHWVLGGPNARTLRLGGFVWTESLIGMWNIVGSEASLEKSAVRAFRRWIRRREVFQVGERRAIMWNWSGNWLFHG